MTIFIDLDNTLCITNEMDYENAKPIKKRIDVVNKLYNQHSITIYTARGSGSGIDFSELTKKQLSEWGVKYHYLSTGEKPVYDLFIDDKALSDVNFFESDICLKLIEQ